MKIEKQNLDNLIIIKPHGRIDTFTSDEFRDELFSVLESDSNIIIDLKDTEFISSSGLRVFLRAKNKLGNHGAFTVINANDYVYEIMDMTGFTQTFHVTREENELNADDIRVVFFDIDGTLLSHTTGKVPESTIKSIRKLQEKGIKIVVATGRDLVEMKKLPLDEIDFDGYLTLNGNICLDKEEKMFAGNEIDQDEVEILVGIFGAGKIPFVLIGEKKRYINYVDDVVVETMTSTHGTVPSIGEYNGEKIYQCMAYVNDEMKKKLDDLLDECIITSWNKTGIDIIAKTGGKAAGIQKFLDKEGITRSQIMAFGDGENDKTMIKFAGIGVAMGNAVDSLKAEADYITADIDDDGVAKALLHFELIDSID